MSSKESNKGLTLDRIYTREGVHPYDEVNWTYRDVEQTNWQTGEVVFSQKEVEFPEFWSVNAATIATTKYFRGAMDTPQRENSLKQLIDRVVSTYAKAGLDHGYFADEKSAEIFEHELTYMLLHQYFAFNSPVWFNVGTSSPQQVSACFILSVDDTMDSILNWYKEEGFIFKGGSGAGLNLSKIRSSRELLSSGGTASGPVSFMRGADASAGTIKSGGSTRRAAKMVVLDVDHPDVDEFIETKVREEEKIRVLRDAGFDMELGGKDMVSVQYQNANNSVRVDDEFMRAVETGDQYAQKLRNGEVAGYIDAREMFDKIAAAAWACADPGVQYKDTINDWHTASNTGPITASNPCSEYLSLDNSSCNLASLNLLKFLRTDNTFDVEAFSAAAEIVFTAMDISICFADFPTEAIGETTRAYRQLGLGYANLGALLMVSGLAYDSDEGRELAGSITALMNAVAYRRSAQLADIVGAYDGYRINKAPHTRVMKMHADAVKKAKSSAQGTVASTLLQAADEEWNTSLKLGKKSGWRNSQATLLAPTGTIGFLMDVDTTGVEPDLSLVKFKKLVGGGSMQIVNQSIPRALEALGYDITTAAGILDYVQEHGSVVGAPGLDPEHYPVFDCSMGERAITAMGHVHMMAALQPHLSGAISKTVNLPESATVEEIAEVYMQGWKLGLKALAVYRDNCKVGQPLSNAKAAKAAHLEVKAEEAPVEVSPAAAPTPARRRLSAKRRGGTQSFRIGELEGYLTTGEYEDGSLGEIFVRVSKQGSILSGIMDALAMSVSVGLQYGVPLETYIAKYVGAAFEPAGLTDDADIRMAKSILDYMFKRIALDYLDAPTRRAFGIFTTEERKILMDDPHADLDALDDIAAEVDWIADENTSREGKLARFESLEPQTTRGPASSTTTLKMEAPMCMTCGTNEAMRPSGACWACSSCGNSTGCS